MNFWMQIQIKKKKSYICTDAGQNSKSISDTHIQFFILFFLISYFAKCQNRQTLNFNIQQTTSSPLPLPPLDFRVLAKPSPTSTLAFSPSLFLRTMPLYRRRSSFAPHPVPLPFFLHRHCSFAPRPYTIPSSTHGSKNSLEIERKKG